MRMRTRLADGHKKKELRSFVKLIIWEIHFLLVGFVFTVVKCKITRLASLNTLLVQNLLFHQSQPKTS